MTVYRRKPEIVNAMHWDGSNESYMQILAWITSFLPRYEYPDGTSDHSTCWCEYWDDYDAPPPERTVEEMSNLRLTNQEFDWRYRMIKFGAVNGEQEMDVDRWIVFRPGEDALPDAFIMRDEEFRAKYELNDELERLRDADRS